MQSWVVSRKSTVDGRRSTVARSWPRPDLSSQLSTHSSIIISALIRSTPAYSDGSGLDRSAR
jgi:hypothetical protein